MVRLRDWFGDGSVLVLDVPLRALLHHGEDWPLSKDHLLQPRLDARWPGALEPGESDASPGRRRIVPRATARLVDLVHDRRPLGDP